jgi:hypothetical protein
MFLETSVENIAMSEFSNHAYSEDSSSESDDGREGNVRPMMQYGNGFWGGMHSDDSDEDRSDASGFTETPKKSKRCVVLSLLFGSLLLVGTLVSVGIVVRKKVCHKDIGTHPVTGFPAPKDTEISVTSEGVSGKKVDVADLSSEVRIEAAPENVPAAEKQEDETFGADIEKPNELGEAEVDKIIATLASDADNDDGSTLAERESRWRVIAQKAKALLKRGSLQMVQQAVQGALAVALGTAAFGVVKGQDLPWFALTQSRLAFAVLSALVAVGGLSDAALGKVWKKYGKAHRIPRALFATAVWVGGLSLVLSDGRNMPSVHARDVTTGAILAASWGLTSEAGDRMIKYAQNWKNKSKMERVEKQEEKTA